MEATGNHGVALNKWSNIKCHIGINKFYERVIFRHIDFERNDDMVENLEKFLKEAEKCYKLGFEDLSDVAFTRFIDLLKALPISTTTRLMSCT